MQVKKAGVKHRIECSALRLFSQHGFLATTVAEIAAEAGVSTGNIYRYYSNKIDLLYSIIPKPFVKKCLNMIRSKIELVRGMDNKKIAGLKSFHIENAVLLQFLIKERQRLLVLLNGCENTEYSDFREEIKEIIVLSVNNHYEEILPRSASDSCVNRKVILDIIYSNLIQAMVSVLKGDYDDKEREAVMRELLSYHLAGISVLR